MDNNHNRVNESPPCSCELAGYCTRHNVDKPKHWHHLCKTRDAYRAKWDAGTGPGQHNPAMQIAREQLRQTRLELCRELWAELHTKQDPTPKWFKGWLRRIPSFGCNCKSDAKKLVKEMPPDYGNWFEWSVAYHNRVNAKLGKPQLTIDEARSIWLTE